MKDKKKIWIIYGVIFLLALALRLYRLGDLPYGLHIDEAGMGYDAYSLAHWGMDRYYKFYPVYFINYGGGQSVLYGYLCAFLMKFAEPSTVLLRIPAVLSGMATWLFGTLLLREYAGEREGLVGSLLLAVSPCFILISRLGLDCFLFSGMAAASLYFFTKAVKCKKKRKSFLLYVLTGVLWGVSLYTYALSWMVLPVFLLLTLIYLKYTGHITWGEIFCMGVPLGILAAPLLIFLAVNTFDLPEIATIRFTIPKLPAYRGAEISLKHVINNIPILIQCLFFHDDYRQNSVLTWFSMYVVTIPFILYGIGVQAKQCAAEIREKRWSAETMVLLWVTAQICMGLCIAEPNVNKLNGIYFGLAFFGAKGLVRCLDHIQSIRGKRWFMLGMAAAYSIFFVTFTWYYFTQYTAQTHPLSMFWATYADVLDEWKDEIGERQVYVDSPYIYYALGEKMSPMDFQVIEQGMTDRGNVHFGLSEEPDENGFYIVFGRSGYMERLTQAGFTVVRNGKFDIAFYP